MPTPNKNESEVDFVNRCIPIVIGDKTAKDGSQGAAICHSIYREHKKKQNSFVAGQPIPASAMSLMCEMEFGDNGPEAKSAPVRMLARTFALEHPFWGKIEHDFGGMTHKAKIPLDFCHDPKELVGYANQFTVGKDGLLLEGALTPYKDDRASEIIAKSKMGVPYQASIDFRGPVKVQEVHEGMSAEVNGHSFEGPGVIVRSWMLRGCAVCPHGADDNTSTQMFTADEEYEAVLVNEISKSELQQELLMSNEVKAEGAKPVEAIKVEAAPAAVETKAEVKAEPQQLSAPIVEAKPEAAVVPAKVETMAEIAKKWLDAYGAAGMKWLAEGKTFDEAAKLHVAALVQENADLKARIEATKATMGAVQPVAASTPASENQNSKPIPEGLTGLERALFTQIRMR